jgi:hypothetical protein
MEPKDVTTEKLFEVIKFSYREINRVILLEAANELEARMNKLEADNERMTSHIREQTKAVKSLLS